MSSPRALTSPADLSASLSTLRISPSAPRASQPRKKKVPVADSWEEELSDSDTTETDAAPETDIDVADTPIDSVSSDGVNPPPPTPTSPHTHTRTAPSISSIALPRSTLTPAAERTNRSERPTTTDSVARRMILAGIGARARSTKEQREYDAAVREKEKKRIAEQRRHMRDAEAEREKAKLSVWED